MLTHRLLTLQHVMVRPARPRQSLVKPCVYAFFKGMNIFRPLCSSEGLSAKLRVRWSQGCSASGRTSGSDGGNGSSESIGKHSTGRPSGLRGRLSILIDPRHQRNFRFLLEEVLLLALAAVLAGRISHVAISDWKS